MGTVFAPPELVRSLTSHHVRVFLRVACAAVLVSVLTQTRADPDLFGHVRFGRDIVAARSAHLLDRYSFTSDRPWINHEWLSEVAMYGAYNAAGAAGLIALKLSLLVLMLGAVALAIRRGGLPDAAWDFLLAVSVTCTFPQTVSVRPQLFSLALFSPLLLVLFSARRDHRVLLWSIPIMAIWVNVHGGWVVGAGTLIVWTACGLLSDRPLRDKLIALGVTAAALAVTLVNPYGLQLWAFLRETVAFGRENIADWQPVSRAGVLFSLWGLVAAVTTVALVVAAVRRTIDLQGSAIVLMLGIGSFRVSRLLSFFALSAVIVLAPQIASMFHRPASDRSQRPAAPWVPAAVLLLALAVIGTGATVSARNLSCIRFEDSLFPEAQAAGILTGRGARGRMLTYFDYGEYAIWHLSPDIVVSMDGRRETVYSNEAVERQFRFYTVPEERKEIVNALRPDYIWMPSNFDVAKDLASDGWKPIFAGPQSVILARGDVAIVPYYAAAAAPRCFPGP
jgi:uncharacterized membrane protein